MALYDVDILAQAFIEAVRKNDRTALGCCLETCLAHVWTFQDFSVWMTDTMHDAADPTQHGELRRQVARSRLDALFSSPAAARLHSDYLKGMVAPC